MSEEPLQLFDPVHIDTSTDGTTTTSPSPSPLEGIVAHLGPVEFAPGNDWVGIRLTGSHSVGQGKNDGSVKGVQYFDAGGGGNNNNNNNNNNINNGLFVKRCNVKKRKLTKLEGLRLRRELSEAGVTMPSTAASASTTAPASSSASASLKSPRPPSFKLPGTKSGISPKRTPVRSSSGSGNTGGNATSATTATATTTAGNDDGKSRLEILRAKREKIARERGAIGSAVSGGGSSTGDNKASAVKQEGTGDNTNDEATTTNNSNTNSNDEPTTPSAPTATTTTTTNNKPNLQTATPAYRTELQRLQTQILALQTSLKQKEAENKSLQSSLDFMSQGAEQTTHDAVRMYALGALALTEAKTPGKKTPGNHKGNDKGGETRMAEGRRLEESEESEKEEGSGSSSDEDGDNDDNDNDDDNSNDNDNDNDNVISQAAAAVSQALVERNNQLQSQLSNLTSAHTALQHQLVETQERLSHTTHKLETATENYKSERTARSNDHRDHTAERSVLALQLSSTERELNILRERLSHKEDSRDHSQVTLARLRAELTSAQRKNEELMEEKCDLETTCEELVLDKEQLREEREVLEDQLEECKIDLESAQLELEDVRCRLEEVESGVGTGGGTGVTDGVGTGGAVGSGLDSSIDHGDETAESSNADAQDVTRSLTLQNTRLRTAILRLREQAELERNDLLRQLKTHQSDATSKEELEKELDTLRVAHASSSKEVQELKDIIDQTTELEETITNLSDKVWGLEEENANLERTIRELEESAEIAAEMEEVQGEELKMMMRDLESRDAMVRNLEEAIRMQRRREEDFQRYVSEFRTSISTLQQEKTALLALTEGDQGEKSHLLATSQKALAQAAQLAANAAEARKRDSEAVFDKIAARSASYLSQRLEMFLPSGVVSSELAAVKGEMLLAKMADKAAVSLTSVEEVFHKAIGKGMAGLSEFNLLENGTEAVLSDASSQQIATMVHQAEFASVTIEAASDALRLMAAGQWPELLSQDLSSDLGSVVVHEIAHLDLALSEQLKLLKQEGVLSPLRSSLTDLDQSVRSTRLALFSATDETGKTVVPEDWKPPGWEALKALSLGRFACLGATAVLSSAISPIEDAENEPPAPTLPNFAGVLEKAKQICTTVLDVCKKLSGLQLDDTETLGALNDLSREYQKTSSDLFDCVKTTFKQQSISSEDMDKCSSLLEEVLAVSRKLAALLRKANLGEHDTSSFNSLSPEFGDSWGGVTRIVSQVRGVDGDSEDVNYLMRARAIEHQLTEAVQNEPKLVIVNAKVASLEKSLLSRSKEIAMQNSRIAELESLISKSTVSSMSPMKGSMGSSTPSPDAHKLKEEVRVLQEALDVMQQQADENEKEIKLLKDKSRPSRVRQMVGGRPTPRKSSSMDIEATLNQLGQAVGSKSGGSSSRDVLLESISLETALFRPALASATQSANYWKAQAMGSALSKLAPLNVSVTAHSTPSSMGDEARQIVDNLFKKEESSVKNESRCIGDLSLARNEVRLAKASFSIIDLTRNEIPSRAQLHEEKRKEKKAELRLQEATKSWLSNQPNKRGVLTSIVPSISESQNRNQGDPCGRITLSCREDVGFTVPMVVNKAELRNFHSFLVQ